MTASGTRRRAITTLVAAAMVAVGLSVIATAPVQATTTFDLERISGDNRFKTAAAVAVETYASATTAVVANARSFADPLAASYLAGAVDGPILLTKKDTVPQPTIDALNSLGVVNVILVGGTAVISPDAQAQLESAGFQVRRVAGADRYATARAVAEDPGPNNPGSTGGDVTGGGSVTAFLATGAAFPDSLSVGGGAYAGQLPLLLTRRDALHPEASTAFDNLGIEHVVILGGNSAVSQEVQTAIEDSGRTTERLAGENRFQTNVAVANWLLANLEFSTTEVNAATGQTFADALAGSAHSGENTRVTLLASSTAPASVCEFLEANQETLESGHIFGGTAAIDESTEDALETCAGRATFRTGIITAVNKDPEAGNDAVKAGTYTISDEATGRLITASYDSTNDTFEVDGAPATVGGFEANLSVGDEVEHFDDGGDDPATADEDEDADVHILTNVDDRNEGLVGNVNTASNTFVIVERVSGAAISNVKSYGSGNTLVVDGDPATLSEFEQDINEGDEIRITDGGVRFALTNKALSGEVSSFSTLVNEVAIGNLGDDATNEQDERFDWQTGAATTTFFVDGSAADEVAFENDVSVPDQLIYARQNGDQIFLLTNVAPRPIEGLGADGGTVAHDPDLDLLTVVNGGDTDEIDYSDVDRFLVDARIVSEAEFEAHYTAGDQIVFQPDDTSTSADEAALALTNADLVGHLADVVTAENRYDVVNDSGRLLFDDLDYTAAVFGGEDSYSIQGAPTVEEFFEGAIDGADGNDVITVAPGTLAEPATSHDYEFAP